MKKPKLDLFDKTILTLLILGAVAASILLFRKASFITVTVRLDQEKGYFAPWLDQSGTRPNFSSVLQAGMTEKDGLGKPQAEVIGLMLYEISAEKHNVYVTVRLKSTYSKTQNTYTYKGRPVAIGEPVTINLERITISGVIVNTQDIQSTQIPRKFRIHGLLVVNDPTYPNTSGVDPYIIQALKIGDQVFDYKNQPVVTLTDIKTKPATTLTTNASGAIISAQNPKKLDAEITFELQGYELGGKYFFLDEVPIIISRTVPLNFPLISIYPTLTKIEVI